MSCSEKAFYSPTHMALLKKKTTKKTRMTNWKQEKKCIIWWVESFLYWQEKKKENLLIVYFLWHAPIYCFLQFCPHRIFQNFSQISGHMIKCLLTEFDLAGLENFSLLVMTHSTDATVLSLYIMITSQILSYPVLPPCQHRDLLNLT